MDERYLTSFDALRDGLANGEPEAIAAAATVLQLAHQSSRSQVVVYVTTLDIAQIQRIVTPWLQDAWSVQRAAWWVLAILEKNAPSKAAFLRDNLGLLSRIDDKLHPEVAVQVLGWLYVSVVNQSISSTLAQTHIDVLRHWLQANEPATALAALQCLIAVNADVSKTDAATVVNAAHRAGIAQADIIGMRCGFLESASRLADQILQDGPWANMAVEALSQELPKEVEVKLMMVPPSRWSMRIRDIHVAHVLAVHGHTQSLDWLEQARHRRDLQKKALSWSAFIAATATAGDEQALLRAGRELLRQQESVRAWVLSTLDPQNQHQRKWLDQALRYGTPDEQRAAQDAFHTHVLRQPLVPDTNS